MASVSQPDRSRCRRTKQGTLLSAIETAALEALFHLPLETAAEQLGLGLTAMKTLCRQHKLSRWPYRKVQCLKRYQPILQRGNPSEEDLFRVYQLFKSIGLPLTHALWSNCLEGVDLEKVLGPYMLRQQQLHGAHNAGHPQRDDDPSRPMSPCSSSWAQDDAAGPSGGASLGPSLRKGFSAGQQQACVPALSASVQAISNHVAANPLAAEPSPSSLAGVIRIPVDNAVSHLTARACPAVHPCASSGAAAEVSAGVAVVVPRQGTAVQHTECCDGDTARDNPNEQFPKKAAKSSASGAAGSGWQVVSGSLRIISGAGYDEPSEVAEREGSVVTVPVEGAARSAESLPPCRPAATERSDVTGMHTTISRVSTLQPTQKQLAKLTGVKRKVARPLPGTAAAAVAEAAALEDGCGCGCVSQPSPASPGAKVASQVAAKEGGAADSGAWPASHMQPSRCLQCGGVSHKPSISAAAGPEAALGKGNSIPGQPDDNIEPFSMTDTRRATPGTAIVATTACQHALAVQVAVPHGSGPCAAHEADIACGGGPNTEEKVVVEKRQLLALLQLVSKQQELLGGLAQAAQAAQAADLQALMKSLCG